MNFLFPDGLARRIFFRALLAVLVSGGAGTMARAAAGRFDNAVKARIDKTYAVVVFADGTKTMVPLASLDASERARLTELSTQKPLAHGKSEVTVVKDTVKVKQTIQKAVTDGPLETVQLCPPSVPRDQIGATCMLYGRVHWLDIAGYYVDNATIYKIFNGTPPDNPWQNGNYNNSMRTLVTDLKPEPLVHDLPPQETDAFEWARGELRKGRPILAAFPKEIWQALPPGYIASRPWSGGKIGHQIVINGFTWNKETRQGTFHIINSWAELPEFDLKTEMAKGGALEIEQSLSPKGEVPPPREKEVVKTIAFIRAAGKTNLYEVETNLGRRRIAAANEAAVRALVEEGR